MATQKTVKRVGVVGYKNVLKIQEKKEKTAAPLSPSPKSATIQFEIACGS